MPQSTIRKLAAVIERLNKIANDKDEMHFDAINETIGVTVGFSPPTVQLYRERLMKGGYIKPSPTRNSYFVLQPKALKVLENV